MQEPVERLRMDLREVQRVRADPRRADAQAAERVANVHEQRSERARAATDRVAQGRRR
jgi:hypothetical protein